MLFFLQKCQIMVTFAHTKKMMTMAEHNKTHPMHSLSEQIDERGLMVFDDIRRMPVYHEPYTTPYMTICLNLEGWVQAECDMQPVCFRRHDIAVLTPHHILCAHESSPDYHAMLIVMSVKFQEEMKRHYTNVYRDNFFYLYQHDLSLTDEQFACVLHLFQMLRTVSLTESDNRWQMLGDLLDVLFLLLQDYRRQNGIDAHKHTPHEVLFASFYRAITEHYQQSREVRFYADMFHLSPKHFATIIKQHTNINALDWINSYVTIQAKILLRYHRQLTVQEIAIRLGFSEQASFSRFYKKNTGLSPTEYREQS